MLVAGIDVRILPRRFTHRTFQVVRYHQFRDSAKELKDLHMGMETVRLLLAPVGAG